MKEWVLKHPVMTFLLVDSLICGLFKTICSFAPPLKTVTITETTETSDKEEEK